MPKDNMQINPNNILPAHSFGAIPLKAKTMILTSNLIAKHFAKLIHQQNVIQHFFSPSTRSTPREFTHSFTHSLNQSSIEIHLKNLFFQLFGAKSNVSSQNSKQKASFHSALQSRPETYKFYSPQPKHQSPLSSGSPFPSPKRSSAAAPKFNSQQPKPKTNFQSGPQFPPPKSPPPPKQARSERPKQEPVAPGPIKQPFNDAAYKLIDSKFNSTTDSHVLLGVTGTPTEAKIKKAYQKMARKVHPDKNLTNQETAGESMKIITEARDRALLKVKNTNI